MKLKSKYILPFVIAAVLAGCAPKLTPEERAAANAEAMVQRAAIMRPMPAIIDACVSYLETGSYSEAALTAVGMEKAFGLSPSYKISVPASNMFGKSDLTLAFNVSPKPILFAGCSVQIPAGSTVATLTGASLLSQLKASGYSVKLSSGTYHSTKGNVVFDAYLSVVHRASTWTELRFYKRS